MLWKNAVSVYLCFWNKISQKAAVNTSIDLVPDAGQYKKSRYIIMKTENMGSVPRYAAVSNENTGYIFGII